MEIKYKNCPICKEEGCEKTHIICHTCGDVTDGHPAEDMALWGLMEHGFTVTYAKECDHEKVFIKGLDTKKYPTVTFDPVLLTDHWQCKKCYHIWVSP